MKNHDKFTKAYSNPDIRRYVKSKIAFQFVDDVIQEAGLKLWENNTEVEDYDAYFFQTIKNTICDFHYRKLKGDQMCINQKKQNNTEITEKIQVKENDFEILESKEILNKYEYISLVEEGYKVKEIAEMKNKTTRQIYFEIEKERNKISEELAE